MMIAIFKRIAQYFDPKFSYIEYFLRDVKDFAELEYKMKTLRHKGYL
jgi:hypothetical protein